MEIHSCLLKIDNFFTFKVCSSALSLGLILGIFATLSLTGVLPHVSFTIGMGLAVTGGCSFSIGAIPCIVKGCKKKKVAIYGANENNKGLVQAILNGEGYHKCDTMTFPSNNNADSASDDDD